VATLNLRLFLWLTFFGLLWLAYTVWTNDYAPAAPVTANDVRPATNDPSTLPSLDESTPTTGTPADTPPGVPPPADVSAPSDLVHVRTDVLDVQINLRGGDLVRADLPAYPVAKHEPNRPVRLLDYDPSMLWVFETGLRSADGGADPNHLSPFRSAAREYTLAAGEDALVVTLDWAGEDGVTAQKVYTFHRGEYAVDLVLKASSKGGGAWRGAPYVQMRRLYHAVKRSYTSVDSYSFSGPVLFNGESYEKHKFEDLAKQPVTQKVQGGWLAAIQHHFLAAAVPPTDDEVTYQAGTRGQDFVLTAIGSVRTVNGGMPLEYPVKLFVGPKLQDQLAATGPKLERAVDFGVLTVLSQPLFWLLSKVEIFVNNWGWAIIIVTIMIKLAFYKLMQTQGRSMAKMRRLAPRMKTLQERYKEDRQALSQAMMDLYKKEKVNPAAGCLPILIQMPFFFAFYWVLVESVEMRQAPFILWIDDLSARDPFYVLPLLMAGAMFLQTKMSPPPPDPVQARMMQIMPLVFSALFFFFPSGLVLYWLTNTLLSILQQWRINKVVEREATT
jgi:YidC/Oxa1 family membrane protein insertase